MIDSARLHTFSVNIDASDGKNYKGTFTVKKMSIKDMTQLGVRRTQLCGGQHYDPAKPGVGVDFDSYFLNSMIAHCELAITDAPPWWNLDELTDMSVLTEVYEEVSSFESTFPGRSSKSQRNGTGAGSQSGSKKTEDQAGTAGVVEQMVVNQVPPSLDP